MSYWQSPELNELCLAATQGDDSKVFVSMNEGKSVLIDGPKDKTLFTKGLGGCYATAVDVVTANGTRHGILTHYSPTDLSRNLETFSRLIPESSGARVRTLIMSPESSEPDSSIDNLSIAIKSRLGKDVPIQIERYPLLRLFGQQDEGSLAIHFPANIAEPATYKTWFSSGKL